MWNLETNVELNITKSRIVVTWNEESELWIKGHPHSVLSGINFGELTAW